ncbi:MAG: glycosyltransferase, partial [Rhabdochlamydiaceae bacterium]
DALFLLREAGVKVVFLTTPPYLDLDYGPWKRYREYGRSGLRLPNKIVVHGLTRPKSEEFRHVFVGPMSSRVRYAPKKGKVVPIILGTTSSSRMKAYGRNCAKMLINLGYEPLVVDNSANQGRYLKNQIRLFGHSQLIVTHGGLSTLEEAAVLGVPTIVLHDYGNEEKTKNAKTVQRLKFGVAVDVTKPFSGSRFIETVKKASLLSDRMICQRNGLKIAVNAIESMLR